MPASDEIDWNDPPLKRWMGTTVKAGTQNIRKNYMSKAGKDKLCKKDVGLNNSSKHLSLSKHLKTWWRRQS